MQLPSSSLHWLVKAAFTLVTLLCLPLYALADPPFVGVWNGFNDHVVVVELSDTGGLKTDLELQVLTSGGEVLGSEAFSLEPFGTIHIDLNKYGITDNHGTYVINAAAGQDPAEVSITGLTAFYRFLPPGSPKPVEYAFAIPLLKETTGLTAGIYNSFNPAQGVVPVYNWLSILVPPNAQSTFSATVEVYAQDGTLDEERTFRVENLAVGQRLDFPLGHEQGQVVGIYRILPDNPAALYAAFLSRFSQKEDGGFRFAFALDALSGSCTPDVLPASTMDPATNWGEVANISGQTLAVDVVVRDQAGTELRNEQVVLSPFSQQHFLLNEDLGLSNLGSFRVACVDPSPGPDAKLLVQSLYYGHLTSETIPDLEWAYASQARDGSASPGSVVSAEINTFLGAFNWFKTAAESPANGAVGANAVFDLVIFNAQGQALQGVAANSVPPGGTLDQPIHELVGPDFIGLLQEELSQTSGKTRTELIRVFPHISGNIGYIMSIPTSVSTPGVGQGTSSSSSGSSSSGGTSSSSSGSSSSSSSSSSGSSSSSSGSSSSGGTTDVTLLPTARSFVGAANGPAVTEQLLLQNNSSETIRVEQVTITGSGASAFSYQAPTTPFSLEPGAFQALDVLFQPAERGAATATLSISTADNEEPLTVTLNGYSTFSARINAGGTEYTDTDGNLWSADVHFSGGKVHQDSEGILGTEDDTLYQSERYSEELSLGYAIPVAEGATDYVVTLHFAEIFFDQVDKRIFDVSAEGGTVVDNLDIVKEGGVSTKLIKRFPVTVSDGVLNLEFFAEKQNPKISAIEVVEDLGQHVPPIARLQSSSINFAQSGVGTETLPSAAVIQNFGLASDGSAGGEELEVLRIEIQGPNAADFSYTGEATPFNVPVGKKAVLPVTFSPLAAGARSAQLLVYTNGDIVPLVVGLSGEGLPAAALTSVFRINAGGAAYTDVNGGQWLAHSTAFTGGNLHSTTEVIANTEDDPLFQTEYFGGVKGDFSFSTPLPEGTYRVTLFFSEIVWDLPGQRFFDVAIEETIVLNNFDILTQTDTFTALARTFEVDVVDGTLNIDFIAELDKAKVSAIAVEQVQ